MDDYLWLEIIKYALCDQWDSHITLCFVNKQFARLVQPFIQKGQIFKTDSIEDGSLCGQHMLAKADRSSRLIDLNEQAKPIHMKIPADIFECMVFVSEPQTVHLVVGGESLDLEPVCGVVWLGMLPPPFYPFTMITWATRKPAKLKLIYWFIYDRTWLHSQCIQDWEFSVANHKLYCHIGMLSTFKRPSFPWINTWRGK